MSKQQSSGSSIKSVFVALVIPIAILVGLAIWKFVMGAPHHFQDNNPELNPLPGDWLGTMYKGGFLVGILSGCLIIVITFSIERFISINRSKGSGSVEGFVRTVRSLVGRGDIAGAKAACDRQRGSMANVVNAGLYMYEQMLNDKELDKERKILAIQKELEEATTLELPMLSKNLVIISTLASVGVLIGLLGTVMGMIKAFAALATAGAPDAVALSTGISEALNNTALGIGTSMLAVVMYNFFTTKIDNITYGIDEAGYSIVQSFAARTNAA